MATRLLGVSRDALVDRPFPTLGVSRNFLQAAARIASAAPSDSPGAPTPLAFRETFSVSSGGDLLDVSLRLVSIDLAEGRRLLVTCEVPTDSGELAPPPSSRRSGLGPFYSSLARELRTPLATVLGFLDLVEDPNTPYAERATWCKKARESGERLMERVQDLVDLGQLEEDTFLQHPQVFYTALTIAQTVAASRETAEARGKSIVVSYTTPIPQTLRSDAHRFRQVLGILMNFAVAQATADSIALQVAVIGQAPHRLLAMDISATCSNLSDTDIATLFDPFARGQSPIRPWRLSFPLARALAQRMGGDLEADLSNERLLLRMTTPSDDDDVLRFVSLTVQTTPTPPPASDAPTFSARRTLVVGPRGGSVMVLRAMLESAGISVEEVNDREQALRRKTSLFDAVVVDMDHPEQQGDAWLTRLRAGGETIPVVVVTGSTTPAHEKLLLDAGATAYLVKPVEKHELLQKLRILFTGANTPPLSDSGSQPLFSAQERTQPSMKTVTGHLTNARARRMLHFVEHIGIAIEMQDYRSVWRACGQLVSLANQKGLEKFSKGASEISRLASSKDPSHEQLLEAMEQLRQDADQIRRLFHDR